MGTTKRKRGTCAYCAKENVSIEVEHVFPESWYPDGYPPSYMLRVPACRPCNDAFDRLEKRLFLPLAASLPDHPRTDSIRTRAIRSADPHAGTSLADIFHRRARGRSFMNRVSIIGPADDANSMWTPGGRPTAPLTTEAGLHVFGTPLIKLEVGKVEALAVKFLRGCYYYSAGVPMPTEPLCWGRNFDRDPRADIDRWRALPGAVEAGGFPFWFCLAADRKYTGAFFVLWNVHVLFAGNAPLRER